MMMLIFGDLYDSEVGVLFLGLEGELAFGEGKRVNLDIRSRGGKLGKDGNEGEIISDPKYDDTAWPMVVW